MVHTTSTLAVAVVALSAASTLAVPNFGAGDFLEARDFYDDNALAARGFFDFFKGKKAASKTSTSLTPTAFTPGAAKEAVAANPAGGALPTVTRHLRPKPTECKVGEKPSWDKVKHAPIHHSSRLSSSEKAQQPLAPGAAPAAPPLAVRSAVPAGSSAGATTQPTPAPQGTGPKKAFGAKDVIATRTMVGKDNHKTVVHVLPPRTTRCYAAAPTGHASANSLSRTASHETAEHALPGAPAHLHPEAHAKLLARAADIIAEYLNQLD